MYNTALASGSTVCIQMAGHRFAGHQSRWPIHLLASMKTTDELI